MKALVNGSIYTPRRLIPDGVVLLDGQRIAAVGARGQVGIPPDAQGVDAQGKIICPGLVDIHVHGGDGADFVDGTTDAVRRAAARHLRAGTTSLLATTGSTHLEQIWQAFDAIGQVMHQPDGAIARILGIHMEGPFLSVAQRGAHNAEMLRMPTAPERERLYSYAGDLLRLTIAPEREGAGEIMSYLSQHGVLISGGHSDAYYGQVCEAMACGLRHITHLWSAMSTVRRIGAKRHAGMLEAALVEEGLTAEIIADGYHLPTSLMQMAHRMKGVEKLCLVSDAMRASGLGPGEYDGCGLPAIVEEGGGVALTADRLAFAGSISTLAQCLQHMVLVVGVSLRDALIMATLTPARIIGVDDFVGQLAPGCCADLLILDRATLLPTTILLAGEVLSVD